MSGERARACASSVETSHARARSPARLPSARYDRKPRRRRLMEPGRARVRVVRPSRRGPNASTCDSRNRACVQFPAGTRAVRLDRAENAGFERVAGSAYLLRSLEREMHDRRAVRAVCSGASSRSEGRLNRKPKSVSSEWKRIAGAFSPLEKSQSGVRARRAVFPDSMRTCARRSFAPATSSIALVILLVFLTEWIRRRMS